MKGAAGGWYTLLLLLVLSGWMSPALAGAPSEPPTLPPLELFLIVGNNLHLADAQRGLRFADDDALRMAQGVATLAPAGQLWLLTDPDLETESSNAPGLALIQAPPTLAALKQAVAEMARAAGAAKDRPIKLLFYFSGHGEPGGILHLADGYLTPEELKTLLGQLGARWAFVLNDACYGAGIVPRGDGATPHPATLFPLEGDIPLASRPPWLGVIAAATPTHEVAALRGGLLTHVALGGLMGLADLNGDGQITFFEWGRYVKTQLARRPNAPEIQVRALERDPLATVLNLAAAGPPSLVLEPDFPAGLIQITVGGTRELVVQHYHHAGVQNRLYLPPGAYDLYHLADGSRAASAPAARVYPSQHLNFTVEVGEQTRLDQRDSLTLAYLVPAALRGSSTLPAGAVVVSITDDDERMFTRFPFETRSRPADLLPARSWQGTLRVDPPWGGVKLGADTGVLTPGFGLRATHLTPRRLEERWLFGTSFLMGYGLTFQPGACCDPADPTRVVDALAHRLRLGLGLNQTWIGPLWRLELEQSFSYAPQLATTGFNNGFKVLADPVRTLSVETLTSHRALQLLQGMGEVSVTLLFPLAAQWEVGPSLQLELLGGVLPGGVYGVPIGTLGVELRPSSLR